MKQVTYAIAFIVRRTGDTHEFLMAEREPNKYMGGTWQLIAGGIEPNETAWQAAVREVKEETDLAVIELYRLSHLTQFYGSNNDSLNTGVMFCAIVNDDAAVKINHENTEFRWITLAEMRALLMWPSDREAFDEVCQVILGNGPSKPHQRIPLPRD